MDKRLYLIQPSLWDIVVVVPVVLVLFLLLFCCDPVVKLDQLWWQSERRLLSLFSLTKCTRIYQTNTVITSSWSHLSSPTREVSRLLQIRPSLFISIWQIFYNHLSRYVKVSKLCVWWKSNDPLRNRKVFLNCVNTLYSITWFHHSFSPLLCSLFQWQFPWHPKDFFAAQIVFETLYVWSRGEWCALIRSSNVLDEEAWSVCPMSMVFSLFLCSFVLITLNVSMIFCAVILNLDVE